jgi:glycerol-3-phosphate dehydrogenase
MVRDLRRLADTHFDVLIVGAGIYGSIAAWDAAQRGLTVGIIDRGDFGSGTSFNNLKTLHGGLRSLQALNLTQMRLFIRERRAMARIAPHLVRLMPCIVPTYASPTRHRAAMRLALAVNDLVAHDRNAGLLDPATLVPGGTLVSRDACLRMNPLIDPEGVTGGAVWHDYQMRSSDRMTLSFLLSAARAGAVTANYVRARTLRRRGARVEGVSVEDIISGATFDITAKIVLNATGPWAGGLLEAVSDAMAQQPAPGLSRAMNLVVRHLGHTHGCGGLARGRFLFAVPWRDRTIIGTSHDPYGGTADNLTLTAADVASFLQEVQEAFPRAEVTHEDVRLVHRGLLPVAKPSEHKVALLRESAVVDHRQHGIEGLVSIFSVRYTTARHTAERAVDTICQALGRKTVPCRTAETPLVGGNIPNIEDHVRIVSSRHENHMSQDALARVAMLYGTGVDALIARTQREPELGQPLSRECRVTGAEIVHAVQSEAALKLSDAVLRRTEAGSAGHPGRQALERASDLLARELGWSEMQRRREIADVEAFYKLPE